MIAKHFDDIDKTDIEALIEDKVCEGCSIEYKSVLPSGLDLDKKEFLFDVSSFANGGGGDILYGVSEKEGIPTEAVGLDGNMDLEKLRLGQIIRAGLEPPIPGGVRIKSFEGFGKGSVLLIRIPRSWNSPHMVSFKKSSRFYVRHNAGKHQMDVTEIRDSFLLADALPERMKRFRDERLARIIANETPVPLCEGVKLILHILPVSSFATKSAIEVSVLKECAGNNLVVIGSRSVYNIQYNLDGIYEAFNENAHHGYTQLFRNGQIEAVRTKLVISEDKKYIPQTYEDYILQAVLKYFEVLKALKVSSPLALFVCIAGVANGTMCDSHHDPVRGGKPINRDTLVLPDILIDDYESMSDKPSVAKALRPVFYAIWNACGLARSLNYDEAGNWKGSPN